VSGYVTGHKSVDGVRINNPHTPDEIALVGLALPAEARIGSAAELWRAADLAERRRDGEYRRNGGHAPILANHADLALPWGTTASQAQQVIDRICRYLVETHRVGVEYAVHQRNGKIDHVHLIWSSRTVGPEGIGKKARGLNAIAHRESKKSGPSALEEIRETASTAIREVCNVDWDHRSFKRRGIDKIPEPKLDQRILREQRRRIEKLGIDATTKVERDLNLFRLGRKRNTGKSITQKQEIIITTSHIAEEALKMEKLFEIEIGDTTLLRQAIKSPVADDKEFKKKPKPDTSGDEDEWIASLMLRHQNHKIQEHKLKGRKPWQWIAKPDGPEFDPKTITPVNPYQECDEDLELIRTALYANNNKDYELRDRAILALSISYKRSFAYVFHFIQCCLKFLKEEGRLQSFYPSCALSIKEISEFMIEFSHARVKPDSSSIISSERITANNKNRERGGLGD
jgi:hypothetical protein